MCGNHSYLWARSSRAGGQLVDRHYIVVHCVNRGHRNRLFNLPEGVTVSSTPVQMPSNLLFERRAIFLNWSQLRKDCFSVGLTAKIKGKKYPAAYVIGVQVFGLCDQVSV